WAGIHALFVLWSCVGSVIAWRFNERAFAQTALILEAAGEGIFGLDTEARIIFINPAAAAILGVDARSAVGKRIGQVAHHLATDGTRLPDADSPILAPLKDRKAHHANDQIFGRVDGCYVPVDYVSTPMIERDQLTGVVVSFNDITARHRSEAALQQSHRMLEETLLQLKTTQQQMLQQERLRAMGQMASGIAHDFNNSLSPIVGFAELLMKSPDLPRETGRRRGTARGQRHRHRHVGRGPAALPGAFLHDEGPARHRPRAFARAHDRPAPRRDPDDRE